MVGMVGKVSMVVSSNKITKSIQTAKSFSNCNGWNDNHINSINSKSLTGNTKVKNFYINGTFC
jgi:hypothetical protein